MTEHGFSDLARTLNALVNLDTLYVSCHDDIIDLLGYKNGKAIYTATFTVRTLQP